MDGSSNVHFEQSPQSPCSRDVVLGIVSDFGSEQLTFPQFPADFLKRDLVKAAVIKDRERNEELRGLAFQSEREAMLALLQGRQIEFEGFKNSDSKAIQTLEDEIPLPVINFNPNFRNPPLEFPQQLSLPFRRRFLITLAQAPITNDKPVAFDSLPRRSSQALPEQLMLHGSLRMKNVVSKSRDDRQPQVVDPSLAKRIEAWDRGEEQFELKKLG